MADNVCEIEVDKRIFTAVVQGDRDAFGDLFQKYYQVLCNYALTYLDDVSEVEDAVQDVFVYVWNNRDAIVVDTSVRSYLFTSVKCLIYILNNNACNTIPYVNNKHKSSL